MKMIEYLKICIQKNYYTRNVEITVDKREKAFYNVNMKRFKFEN